MRLGFFGGTFDPPHLGHQAIAQAAADRFGLDRVLWAPAARQPLKSNRPITRFEERIAMVALACQADPRFVPSDLDAPRPDGSANYTIDTLERLERDQPDASLFCLAGADSFAELRHWKRAESLLNVAEWIVVSRPGFSLSPPRGMDLAPEQQRRIHPLDGIYNDIAATVLREQLSSGDPCHDVLSPAVAAYIESHKLYR